MPTEEPRGQHSGRTSARLPAAPRPGRQEAVSPIERAMRALSLATGIRVVDEAPFVQGLEHVHQRVVHHPVREGRGRDAPGLRPMDLEVAIAAGAPRAVGERGLEREEVLDAGVPRRRPRVLGTACAAGPSRTQSQVLPRHDAGPEVGVRAGQRTTSRRHPGRRARGEGARRGRSAACLPAPVGRSVFGTGPAGGPDRRTLGARPPTGGRPVPSWLWPDETPRTGDADPASGRDGY